MTSHRTLPFVLVLTGACHGGGKDAGATDTGGATGTGFTYGGSNAGWYDYTDSGTTGATDTGSLSYNNYDGDGATVANDCDDSNPYVYPGATEDCANGIDDDCDGLIDGDRTLPNALGELCDGDDDNADGVVDEGWSADCILPECEDTGTTAPVRGGGLNWGRLGWAEPEPAPSTRSLRRVGSWVLTD